jgi:hypothetical protein
MPRKIGSAVALGGALLMSLMPTLARAQDTTGSPCVAREGEVQTGFVAGCGNTGKEPATVARPAVSGSAAVDLREDEREVGADKAALNHDLRDFRADHAPGARGTEAQRDRDTREDRQEIRSDERALAKDVRDRQADEHASAQSRAASGGHQSGAQNGSGHSGGQGAR